MHCGNGVNGLLLMTLHLTQELQVCEVVWKQRPPAGWSPTSTSRDPTKTAWILGPFLLTPDLGCVEALQRLSPLPTKLNSHTWLCGCFLQGAESAR